MEIAYLCSDAGIDVEEDRAPGVHVRSCVEGLRSLGHRVRLFCRRRGSFPWSPVRKHFPALDGLAHNASLDFALARSHARQPFDLVLERQSLWSLAGLRRARIFGVPFFLEVNAPLVEEATLYRGLRMRRLAASIQRRLWREADRILAVSNELRAILAAAGVNRDRIAVLPNGVSLSRFCGLSGREEARLRYGLGKAFVIGYVGGFQPWHGAELLPAAIEAFGRDERDWRLLVLGDGPLNGSVARALRERGLAENVHWTGQVSNAVLLDYLRAMDAAVIPAAASPSAYFSPIKLFELMCAGVPIVAGRRGQPGEILEHERTGLLVRPEDPAALAQALKRLRGDPDWAASLARAAREQVLRRYTWEGNARRIEELARAIMRP